MIGYQLPVSEISALTLALFCTTGSSAYGTESIASTAPDRRALTRALSSLRSTIVTESRYGSLTPLLPLSQ